MAQTSSLTHFSQKFSFLFGLPYMVYTFLTCLVPPMLSKLAGRNDDNTPFIRFPVASRRERHHDYRSHGYDVRGRWCYIWWRRYLLLSMLFRSSLGGFCWLRFSIRPLYLDEEVLLFTLTVRWDDLLPVIHI